MPVVAFRMTGFLLEEGMAKRRSSVRQDLTALAFLGPLEARVMEVVWSRDSVTVRDVYTVLAREKDIAYTTVMTVLGNLNKKGLVQRTQDGQAYVYTATQTKQEFVQSRVAELVDTLLDRFSEPALTHFIQRMGQADAARLKELERIVAEPRRSNQDGSP
jgi:BlaI family transcriptional regulator, penicillinase repressor